MARTIKVGAQGFEGIRANGCFYVDKTGFVRDWWLAQDDVTLVCRPRRFGKTLNLDTVRCFLSLKFAGRGEELFGFTSKVYESATVAPDSRSASSIGVASTTAVASAGVSRLDTTITVLISTERAARAISSACVFFMVGHLMQVSHMVG